jgi:hypothetical protein
MLILKNKKNNVYVKVKNNDLNYVTNLEDATVFDTYEDCHKLLEEDKSNHEDFTFIQVEVNYVLSSHGKYFKLRTLRDFELSDNIDHRFMVKSLQYINIVKRELEFIGYDCTIERIITWK